jgi:hypothetical protein
VYRSFYFFSDRNVNVIFLLSIDQGGQCDYHNIYQTIVIDALKGDGSHEC